MKCVYGSWRGVTVPRGRFVRRQRSAQEFGRLSLGRFGEVMVVRGEIVVCVEGINVDRC